MNKKGILYVISGPSGTGKSSLVSALSQAIPDMLVSVSYTTREKRPGEVNAENYHFISRAEFLKMIENNELLEYANVFSKISEELYGTGRAWVEQALVNGKNVILEIDWQGAEQIFKNFPEAIGIFILPPSLEELEKRLISRGRDNIEMIKKRMLVARDDIAHYKQYHWIIINNDFNDALSNLIAIARSPTTIVEAQLLHGLKGEGYRNAFSPQDNHVQWLIAQLLKV